jgi:hypothetical protein
MPIRALLLNENTLKVGYLPLTTAIPGEPRNFMIEWIGR